MIIRSALYLIDQEIAMYDKSVLSASEAQEITKFIAADQRIFGVVASCSHSEEDFAIKANDNNDAWFNNIDNYKSVLKYFYELPWIRVHSNSIHGINIDKKWTSYDYHGYEKSNDASDEMSMNDLIRLNTRVAGRKRFCQATELVAEIISLYHKLRRPLHIIDLGVMLGILSFWLDIEMLGIALRAGQ